MNTNERMLSRVAFYRSESKVNVLLVIKIRTIFKVMKNFIERNLAYKHLIMLGITGFIGQSCYKSELILKPEGIIKDENYSNNSGKRAIKDSTNLQSDTGVDSTLIVIDSTFTIELSDSLKTSINNLAINTVSSSAADIVYNTATIAGNQPTSSTNNAVSNTSSNPPPSVIVPVIPAVEPDNNQVPNEITIKTSQGLVLHPPKNLLIGLSKAYPLATDTYTDLLSQMPGGENEFWFYGKANQYNYPSADWVTQANGYSTIDLPTHAINARAAEHSAYKNVICKIEYIIKDTQGNIVMYCKDTKGGFHPSFMPNSRGNNHPKESQRFLPYGTYIVEFKNLTEGNINAPIRVTFNRSGAGGTMGEYFDTVVDNQKTVSFTINIFEQNKEAGMFKLNCNMVP